MPNQLKDYAIFGGRLRSPIHFPELLELSGDGPCDWRLSVVDSPAPATTELVAQLAVAPGVIVRLYRHADGLRLTYDDTGTFDVAADGRSVFWCPAPDAPLDSARLDVVGLVLALALHVRGVYTLHGSAVSVGSSVVAFTAPKNHGKSTLAMAMVLAGARLVTDDSVAVSVNGATVLASPGIHSVRLRDDAFLRLRSELAPAVSSQNGKRLLQMAEARSLTNAAPLEAVYLLQPVPAASGREAVRRTRMEPRVSALVLVGHAKLAALLEGTLEAAALLQRAAEVARSVPVYALEVVRDFERLPEVVGIIAGWHGQRRGAPGSIFTSDREGVA